MRRDKPVPVQLDIVSVPINIMSKHRLVTVAFDVFFVNKVPFSLTVSRKIRFIASTDVPDRTPGHVCKALLQVFQFHAERGFEVVLALCDPEFECLRPKLEHPNVGVKLNTTSKNEHVPEAERAIRLVKERTRCVWHTLPFKAIPRLMVAAIVLFCATWLNAFPPKGGVSTAASPREIMTGLKLDCNRHCRVAFGACVQKHEEDTPHDSQKTRTVGAISLEPNHNSQQGGHCFVKLSAGRPIRRRSWTDCPMPVDVVQRVEALAKRDGQKPLLHFENRSGVLIENEDIPGVDDEEANIDDKAVHNDNPDHNDGQDNIAGVNDDDNVNDPSADIDDETLPADDDNDNNDSPLPNNNHDDDAAAEPLLPNEGGEDAGAAPGATIDDEAPPHMNDEDAPPPHGDDNSAVVEQQVEQQSNDDPPTLAGPELRCGSRTRKPVLMMEPKMKGNSHGEKASFAQQASESSFCALHPDGHCHSFFQSMDIDPQVIHIAVHQVSVRKGLKLHGDRAREGMSKEMQQLHMCDVFEPVSCDDSSEKHREEMLESHLFLKEKRDSPVRDFVVLK